MKRLQRNFYYYLKRYVLSAWPLFAIFGSLLCFVALLYFYPRQIILFILLPIFVAWFLRVLSMLWHKIVGYKRKLKKAC
jgi:hypothetical protein